MGWPLTASGRKSAAYSACFLQRLFKRSEDAVFHKLSLLFRKALLGWLASLVLVPPALAGDAAPVNADNEKVAINGDDTVAYFTDGHPVKGDSHYEYVWREDRWRFASAAHRAPLA